MSAVRPQSPSDLAGNPLANSEETVLLGGRVRMMQPLQGYRAAIDPVLMAAAVPMGNWTAALDVGAGTGAATLCLLARSEGRTVTGIELLDAHATLARHSLQLNGLDARGVIVTGDILDRPSLPSHPFDQVMTNPPFHGPGNAPAHGDRAVAHMETIPLEVWIGFCLRMLKPRGGLTVIHRADRLDHLLKALYGKAGAVEIIPLWPKAGVAAKRVIVRARKGLKSPMILHPGLVLHQADGRYSDAAEAILRDGAGLDTVMESIRPGKAFS